MFSVTAQIETMTTDETLALLFFAAIGMLVATAIGFAGGIHYERTTVQRALRRTRRQVEKLFHVIVTHLNDAQQVCTYIENAPHVVLSSDQTTELDSKRQTLLESLSKIVELQKPSRPDPDRHHVTKRKATNGNSRLAWQLPSSDTNGLLPDQECLTKNLELLVDDTDRMHQESGFLLVKIDKMEQLKKRVGDEGATRFLDIVASLSSRAIRDCDLVCQYSEDTLGILFPHVTAHDGQELSDSIRNAIRHHHFRLEETGPEVLVTASLGYTQCVAHDHPDLVLNRAGDALAKSQCCGRNQLHVYDGASFVHCLAG